MGHKTKSIKEKYLPEVLRLRREGLGIKRISARVSVSYITIELWLAGQPKIADRYQP